MERLTAQAMQDPRAAVSAEALLLSDEYWHGDGVIDPPEAEHPGLRSDLESADMITCLRDTITVLHSHEKAREIGRHVVSMSAGGTRDSIATGEVIELPDDHSRKVIKVVEDSRRLIPKWRFKYHPSYKFMRQCRDVLQETEDVIPGYFEDSLAALLSDDTPLTSIMAKYVPYDRKYVARISRYVYYARGIGSPYCGVRVAASRVAPGRIPLAEEIAANRIVGRTVRGLSAYGESLSKIAVAEVLEPTSIVWSDTYGSPPPMNRRREEQTQQKRVWLPTLAPGVAPNFG